MAKLVALNNKQHQQVGIDTQLAEAEGAELHLVPVVITEFLKLVVHYPIVFSKNGDTGQFMCSALIGLEEGENLFYEKGQWNSIYLPLQLARQPFFLGLDDSSTEKSAAKGSKKNTEENGNTSSDKHVANTDAEQNFVVCINTSHSSVKGLSSSANTSYAQNPDMQPNTHEKLFTANGEATPYLQGQQNRLVQLLQGEQQTQEFIATLLNMKLITAIALDIKLADDTTHKVNGLYSIDEEKLDQISHEQLITLKEKGYLSPIYTLIASTSQIYTLIDKKNQRIEQGAKWFQAANS